MAISGEAKAQILSTYKVHEKDTGSPEVQIALLTHRINDLRAILTLIRRITPPVEDF